MFQVARDLIVRVGLLYKSVYFAGTILDAIIVNQLIISAYTYVAQGTGSLLVRKVDGDWNNVVGFPAASFFQWLDLLVEEEDDFLSL